MPANEPVGDTLSAHTRAQHRQFRAAVRRRVAIAHVTRRAVATPFHSFGQLVRRFSTEHVSEGCLHSDGDRVGKIIVADNQPSLSKSNCHPRDADIQFSEKGHVYHVRGDLNYTSCTAFVRSFFNKFDADSAIANMRQGRNWRNSPYHGMADDDIKAQWAASGAEASRLGKRLHACIEHFYNGWPLPSDDTDATPGPPDEFIRLFSGYHTFVSTEPRNWKPFRSEWCIYDEESKLAGTVDMLYQVDEADPSKLVIVDWKRSKEIKRTAYNQVGKGPLSMVPDCNFYHYSLQLNLYRWILEKQYGKSIVGMYLVVVHPNQGTYIEEVVPETKDYLIAEMLAARDKRPTSD